MESEEREAIRSAVEHEARHVAVVGESELERRKLLRGIVERRESLRDWAMMENYKDWGRAVDGEFEAIVVPNIAGISEKRRGQVLEGLREGAWVVAVGVRDLDEAVASGELGEELYEELDPVVVEADELFGAWHEDVYVETIFDEALLPEAERPSASAPAFPDALRAWCERAGIDPAERSRQSHREEGELWTITVDAETVEAPWQQLMTERAGTGYYPVVTGAKDPVRQRRGDVERLLEEYQPNRSLGDRDRPMDQWLVEARRLDVDDWIDSEIDYVRADTLGAAFFESDAIESPEEAGFPDPAFTGRIAGTFAISLVPVDAGWKVPAFFHYGGFVPNPTPDCHAALLKRWSDRSGVRLASMTVDTMELFVPAPIRDAERARQMARELLVYDGAAEATYASLGGIAEAIWGEAWISLYFDTI